MTRVDAPFRVTDHGCQHLVEPLEVGKLSLDGQPCSDTIRNAATWIPPERISVVRFQALSNELQLRAGGECGTPGCHGLLVPAKE